MEIEEGIKDLLDDSPTLSEPIIVDEEPKIEEPLVEAPPVVEEPPPYPPLVSGEPPISSEPPVAPVEHPSSQVSGESSISEPPTAVVDPKDAQIAQLTSTIEQLRGMVETMARQASTSPVAPVEPDTPIEEPIVRFIEKEDDLDEVLNSTDSFNKFMTSVVKKSKEDALSIIPQLVNPIVNRIVTQKLAINEFYANNADLAAHKATVGIVANEIAQANPTHTLEDIIKVLGPEVRNRLAMGNISVSPAVAPVSPAVETPAFAPGSTSRAGGGAPPVTKMEQGIAELLDGLDIV